MQGYELSHGASYMKLAPLCLTCVKASDTACALLHYTL